MAKEKQLPTRLPVWVASTSVTRGIQCSWTVVTSRSRFWARTGWTKTRTRTSRLSLCLVPGPDGRLGETAAGQRRSWPMEADGRSASQEESPLVPGGGGPAGRRTQEEEGEGRASGQQLQEEGETGCGVCVSWRADGDAALCLPARRSKVSTRSG